MWVNPLFKVEAVDEVRTLVAHSALATVVSPAPLRAAHLPLLLDPVAEGSQWRLVGHIPLSDPMARELDRVDEVLAIFHGPRSYVSPEWYLDVGLPTYNFTVVHFYGAPRLVHDEARLRAHLLELITHHETHRGDGASGDGWTMTPLAQQRMESLLRRVVCFEIEVTSIQAKAKLGQNRSAEERIRVEAALSSSPNREDVELADEMRALIRRDGGDERWPGPAPPASEFRVDPTHTDTSPSQP